MTLPERSGPQPVDKHQPDAASSAPPASGRSIFRSVALAKYVQNQEKVVLPPSVSPAGFIELWVFAGFVMVVGLALVFWPWLAPYVVGAP